MPAIVDTDKLDSAISVAGFLTSREQVELLPGMPFVQIIPFKRDTWSMNISAKLVNSKLKHFLFDGYKRLFHSKKDFS
jgi:hypothetical protein